MQAEIKSAPSIRVIADTIAEKKLLADFLAVGDVSLQYRTEDGELRDTEDDYSYLEKVVSEIFIGS